MTVTDNSTTSAIPLMECMKNDGSLFETKPDLDPTKTLAVLPFSSGTTGPPKGKRIVLFNILKLNFIFHGIKEIRQEVIFYRKHSYTYVRFISYFKCSKWPQILKLSSSFGCLFTFFYLDGAN